ncbi:PEPxxWA-CTERM sorting domain-containing protein [Sandarakinorhabdus sp.]|uniref:PEPxxWA-CTERM sorting domain-containing protein n=1 Tax=Sandarakinorhabdus sp. TaxID=1916663 RepID=UPI003F6FC2F7
MKSILSAAALVTALLALPAQATSRISVIDGACNSVSDAAGCRFTGNITAKTVDATQGAYNLYNDSMLSAQPDIQLNYLFDTDAGLPGNVSVTGLNDRSGTWSTPGILVDFIATKAGNGFTLFKLAAPASSGTWNTGVQQGLSHLSFMTGNLLQSPSVDPQIDVAGGVPEPSSWAMLIAGFGLVGVFSRRRRRQVTVAA